MKVSEFGMQNLKLDDSNKEQTNTLDFIDKMLKHQEVHPFDVDSPIDPKKIFN